MTAANKQQPYIIKAEPREERYARGWYVIGSRASIADKPITLNAFGTRLAVFRGEEDGAIHALDAFCPHMGGDLSQGFIRGNSLVCPFHEWSWDKGGVCDHIPYAKKIPEKAVIKSWPVLEKNGLIFVWNDVSYGWNHPELGQIGPVPPRRPAGHTGPYGMAWLSGDEIAPGDYGIRDSWDVIPTLFDILKEPYPEALSGVSLLNRADLAP